MNKYIKILITSILCSAQIFASHGDCFRKYSLTLANQSGGIADFKSTKGIRGACRKTELENNSAIKIWIQRRGAKISIKAGPEGSKTTRTVTFYSKHYKSHNPSVTLNQKSFTTEGFSQKLATFSVKIENQSGGIARILDACDASGKGISIGDDRSTKIVVKPSSNIIVEYGPEKQKNKTKIVFADQTGEQPTVTLAQRGFFSRGIQSRNLEIQAQRVPVVRYRRRHMRKMHNTRKPKKKMRKKFIHRRHRRHKNRK